MRRIGPGIRSVTIPEGPSYAEQMILGLLCERGKLTPGEMAACMKVKPQSIGQTLEPLVRRGWIVRCHSEADRRCVLVSASPEGQAIHERMGRARQAWLERILSGLSETELESLSQTLGHLERVTASMDKWGINAPHEEPNGGLPHGHGPAPD